MKIAVIGQSAFGAAVYQHLLDRGHEVVGVFTITDAANGGREDPLAAAATAKGHPVFKLERWRALKKDGGRVLPDVLEKYQSTGAQLNVLAFVTQFIPMEISQACEHGSIIYHPSLLPKHRGASAINWALMEGAKKTGLTIFWADEGLDTGPILLQKECEVEPDDTVSSIYKRFLFPEGVKAMGEAVDLIANGNAPRVPQSEEGASYDPIWKDPKLARMKFDRPAQLIHNFIRGNDRSPGAWAIVNGKQVTLFGSHLTEQGVALPEGLEVEIEGAMEKAIITNEGLFLRGTDQRVVRISTVKLAGKIFAAPDFERVLGNGVVGDVVVETLT
eukprot:TRINITY_DN7090_c0_g2_i1.p1 TRINITY_DN7090_c0_g2~~TRINITY_DN7090_c0_g2_i1.p1  ORF type:complete len:331 (+),score=63.05 TRINITY_DN7090_c0_g2_i1:590-1582(+)